MVTSAELAEHRPYLLRYAMMQLRDESQAEDAVQETLLAALQANFSAQSSLRTWLTGILKHKIIDLVRKQIKEPNVTDEFGEAADVSDFDALFDQSGHWDADSKPKPWRNPNEALEQKQFWKVYEECSQVMPKRAALIFSMREVMGMEIEEICKNLTITTTNCSVILYRARMTLRLCFDSKWFDKAPV